MKKKTNYGEYRTGILAFLVYLIFQILFANSFLSLIGVVVAGIFLGVSSHYGKKAIYTFAIVTLLFYLIGTLVFGTLFAKQIQPLAESTTSASQEPQPVAIPFTVLASLIFTLFSQIKFVLLAVLVAYFTHRIRSKRAKNI